MHYGSVGAAVGALPPLSGVRWVEQILGRLSQGSISKRDIRPKLRDRGADGGMEQSRQTAYGRSEAYSVLTP